MKWFKVRPKNSTSDVEHKPAAVPVDEASAASRFPTGDEEDPNRCNGAATRIGRRKYCRPIEHVDAPTQAAALLELIQEWDHDFDDGRMMDYERLSAVYRQMCDQNHWRQRDWGRVGRHFALLTTEGRKPYTTFYDNDGRPRKRRVYPIPKK